LFRDDAPWASAGAVAEARLRRVERQVLTPLIPGARAARARSASTARSLSVGVPEVGAQMELNAGLGLPPCHSMSPRAGRVVAVSQRAVLIADNGNPTGGFTDAEYAEFGAAFDGLIHPVLTENFGTPSDIDNNVGRVLIFFTRAVNEREPPAAGIFGGRDLFPKVGPDPNSSTDDCPGSNEAEMFYVHVPDPNGEVNGAPRSKLAVKRSIVSVLGHEYQHLINASRRLYVNDADDFEDAWLDEGLAHIAQELLFYRASGLAPKQNIALQTLLSSQVVLDAANTHQAGTVFLLGEYLRDPESRSPYSGAASQALESVRGATWQLLRYAADRRTTAEQTLWFGLANSKTTGTANFEAATGTDILALVRDWATAQYTDDALPTADASLRHPSWNFRSLVPPLTVEGAFPLKTHSLVSGTPTTLTLNGGGAAYLRFGAAARGVAVLHVSSGGAAPTTAVSLTLVRTK
jgi:hypothetical protein